jgi:hypothetical protein
MLPAGMSIEVRPGKEVTWLRHLLLSILTRGVFDTARMWNWRGKYWPRVVLERDDGSELTLFAEQRWDDAVAKRDRLRDEASVMSFEAWCDRYVLR